MHPGGSRCCEPGWYNWQGRLKAELQGCDNTGQLVHSRVSGTSQRLADEGGQGHEKELAPHCNCEDESPEVARRGR